MSEFNFKQWLIENKSGMYSKIKSDESFDVEGDGTLNRDDLQELDPAALGAPQAAADAEMEKKDDENGDWVDNASMDVVAEEDMEETVGYVMKVRKPGEKPFFPGDPR